MVLLRAAHDEKDVYNVVMIETALTNCSGLRITLTLEKKWASRGGSVTPRDAPMGRRCVELSGGRGQQLFGSSHPFWIWAASQLGDGSGISTAGLRGSGCPALAGAATAARTDRASIAERIVLMIILLVVLRHPHGVFCSRREDAFTYQ
jgi:hypothetical protein